MPLTPDQLAEQAMKLSPRSRADLAEKLVESLNESELVDIQKLWTREALRRREEVRNGKILPIDSATARSEVRRAINR